MFDPERAEIRFGCGLSPRHTPVASVADMLARLSGPDGAKEQFPIPALTSLDADARQFSKTRKVYFNAKTDAMREEARAQFRKEGRAFRKKSIRWFGQTLLRRAQGEDPMRERLTAFWADHFTARGRDAITIAAQAIYIDEAIRPHVAGRFADMLKAVIVHPVMLVYLDQVRSVGPNSPFAKKKARKKLGLNENLAREVMELHTLGVDGPYVQNDVRELAKLLTGLHYSIRNGFSFQVKRSEPGTKTVLGKTYAASGASLEHVFAALDDLARHPATAAHLARKLAVHFVSDTPDPEMIDAMARSYRETDGNLLAVCEAMLHHPSAWKSDPSNVKQPIDFIGSTMRALDIQPRQIQGAKPGRILQNLMMPLALMGQEYGRAPGPDGWPEADPQWITPQRLAARLQWAMAAPHLMRWGLPDPRDFVDVALGQHAPEAVRFAARAAENRAEGVGLVLASPAFQRM